MAGSVALYGGIAVLIFQSHVRLTLRVPLIGLCVVIPCLVGISRVMVRSHSWQEVVAGALIGAILPAILGAGALNLQRAHWRRFLQTFAALGGLTIFIGVSFPGLSPEPWIDKTARGFASSLNVCRAGATRLKAPQPAGRTISGPAGSATPAH